MNPRDTTERGTFLDRRARDWMVRAWSAELAGDDDRRALVAADPDRARIPEPWIEAADAVREVVRGWATSPTEARERVLDVVLDAFDRADWEMRASDENPRNAPIARDLEHAADLAPLRFAERAADLLARVHHEVPGGAYAVGALEDALSTSAGATEVQAEVVKQLVLERWEQSLQAREAEWQRAVLQRAVARVAEDLRRKHEAVSRVRHTLGLELAYAGFGLDWSAGLFQPGVWATLDEYATLVESNPSLTRLAQVLGRYEEARGRLEREEVREPRPDRRPRLLRGGRSEVKGIHLGDELDRLTAGDLALLADPELEMVFYLRYLEKRLLTYEMEGRETYAPRAPSERTRTVDKAREKGPILLCLDTSGSMAGEPELVAKTLCLALLRVALRERRPCWAISFSSTADLREQELSRLPQSLPALLRFLAVSFRGGTDPVPALEAALRRLESTEWSRADVLWISDGLFTVPDEVTTRVAQLKDGHDARFHVLLVGDAPAPPFTDVSWRWSAGASFASGAVQLVEDVAARSRGA